MTAPLECSWSPTFVPSYCQHYRVCIWFTGCHSMECSEIQLFIWIEIVHQPTYLVVQQAEPLLSSFNQQNTLFPFWPKQSSVTSVDTVTSWLKCSAFDRHTRYCVVFYILRVCGTSLLDNIHQICFSGSCLYVTQKYNLFTEFTDFVSVVSIILHQVEQKVAIVTK